MKRGWTIGVLVVLAMAGGHTVVAGANPQDSQPSVPSATFSITGVISSLDLNSFSPTLIVTDGSGKATTIMVDVYRTAVSSSQGSGKQLSDLAVGQEVQVTGRNMSHVGRFTAKSITITKESVQAAPLVSKPAANQAAAVARKSSGPRTLKSIPSVEKSAPKSAAAP